METRWCPWQGAAVCAAMTIHGKGALGAREQLGDGLTDGQGSLRAQAGLGLDRACLRSEAGEDFGGGFGR